MIICWPMFFENTCFYHIVSGRFSRKLLPCSIPGSGRSPGGENGNPPQCSYLGSPMNRVSLQATVHGVAKSWTWLRDWVCAHTHTHTLSLLYRPLGQVGLHVCTFKSHSSVHGSPVGLVGMTTIIPQSQILSGPRLSGTGLKSWVAQCGIRTLWSSALGFEFPPDHESLCQE